MTAVDTPRHIADTVTEILVKANLTGHDSHGVLRIPAYLQAVAEGRLDPAAEPTITKETANLIFVDGQNGFGHYMARQAMNWAIEKAKQDQERVQGGFHHGSFHSKHYHIGSLPKGRLSQEI